MTVAEQIAAIKDRVSRGSVFSAFRSDVVFLLGQLEWALACQRAALESQERVAVELVEHRQKTLETYEHNGILVRERDAARGLAEDAEARLEMFEANVAESLKRLREEKLALESALRTAGQRIEELVLERDTRAKIFPHMAKQALDAPTTIQGFDVIMSALRECVEAEEARKG